MKRSRRWCR